MITPKTIKPIGQGIIVERWVPPAAEVKTQGGIIVSTESVQENNNVGLGTALAVGKEVKEVKVGDLVMFRLPLAIPLPCGPASDRAQLFKFDELNGVVIGVIPGSDFKKLNDPTPKKPADPEAKTYGEAKKTS